MYIHNSLIDLERRAQEILDDIRSLKEQVYYAYDSDADTEISQAAFEADQQEAFEHLVNTK
jgi:hypothetical protein